MIVISKVDFWFLHYPFYQLAFNDLILNTLSRTPSVLMGCYPPTYIKIVFDSIGENPTKYV
nr:MAG TPA: hypothetical protein [Caudoviricetes sp.]